MYRSMTVAGLAAALLLSSTCASAQAATNHQDYQTTTSQNTVTNPTGATQETPSVESVQLATPDFSPSIQLRAWGGLACSHDESSVWLTPTSNGFALDYPNLTARGTGFVNCQAMVKVAAPSGWTYAVTGTQTRGYATLGSSADARVETTWYHSGSTGTGKALNTVTGPYSDSWIAEHSTEPIWAQCNTDRYLNVNSIVSVDGPSTSAMAIFSSAVQLSWRRC